MRLIAVHYVLGQLQQVAAQVRTEEARKRERGGAATESEEINASLKRNRKSGSERGAMQKCRERADMRLSQPPAGRLVRFLCLTL